jgi:hypothetical protein
MQTSTPIIDLHVHSTLKPYGNSFYLTDIKSCTDSSCLWFVDRRNNGDVGVEGILGICRYRQSDFRTLTDGQVKIAFVSLYPVEKQFFEIRKKSIKPFEVVLAEFASLFGKKRINYIRSSEFSYFKDLCDEYKYLSVLNGIAINSRKYELAKNSSFLNTDANLIVIPSVEGCHAFSDGNNPRLPESWTNIENNVKIVKLWEAPPLFVTFAHHFYNGLCTHAKSLYENSGKLLDQEYGMRNYGLTPKDSEDPISIFGKKLIGLLLSKSNGRRILIDVKHMSLEARKVYYEIITNEYSENIPVIWSHGAVAFDNEEINMSLEQDVAMIYKTKGIIGIEMDQRILGYNKNRFWKTIKSFFRRRNKAYEDAGYFWMQVITIAEFAYKNGYSDNPWKCIALGSDYDGIINSLNLYPDATSLSLLYNNLIIYLNEYWEENNTVIPKNLNNEDAADVIYNVMYKNAYNFISNNYN